MKSSAALPKTLDPLGAAWTNQYLLGEELDVSVFEERLSDCSGNSSLANRIQQCGATANDFRKNGSGVGAQLGRFISIHLGE
jgi:hypothetical protein